MSPVMRKPVFRGFDLGRLKPVCSAKEFRLSRQRKQRYWSDCADAQAELRRCCSHMAKTGFLMTWLKYDKNDKIRFILKESNSYLQQQSNIVFFCELISAEPYLSFPPILGKMNIFTLRKTNFEKKNHGHNLHLKCFQGVCNWFD